MALGKKPVGMCEVGVGVGVVGGVGVGLVLPWFVLRDVRMIVEMCW